MLDFCESTMALFSKIVDVEHSEYVNADSTEALNIHVYRFSKIHSLKVYQNI